MKKLTSFLLAILMSFSLATAALAADPLATITISGSGASFSAYRLLDLTTSLKDETDAVHNGHADGSHTEDCYNHSYTVNGKYRGILQTVCGATADTDSSLTVDDEEIVAYIGGMTDNGPEIRAFANAVWAAISAGSIVAEDTQTDKTFAGVAQGYYLIAETNTLTANDARSLVILDTAGQEEVTVTTKEGVPTLVKKVEEIDDCVGTTGSWQDSADHDIGDGVRFMLTADLPDNIGTYTTYQMTFFDKLSAGLSLKEETVEVKLHNKEVDISDYTVTNSGLTDDYTFSVSIADIKAVARDLGETLTGATTVTVTYEAELLAAADIGTPGNPNTAYLEFSNDPYLNTSTAETPEDTVVVFTYQTVVNKVNAGNVALTGANFKLQKWNPHLAEYVDYKTITPTEGQTTFSFVGLDAGKYRLVETAVPDGYNAASDIEFEVDSTLTVEADEPTLQGLAVKQGNTVVSTGDDALFQINLTAGSATTSVVNIAGIHLPSTGGMGVYAIYAAGAALFLGGGVMLLRKKKTAPEGETESDDV